MPSLRIHDRRRFLRQMGRLSLAAGTPFAGNLLGIGSAAAQAASDFKTLVCVFLAGGNDQSNTVVPSGGTAYDEYARARPTLALPTTQLRTIAPAGWSGPALGLHEALAPIEPLFAQGRLAILANVGTLVAPLTRQQWNGGRPSVAVPTQLFSHSDQTGAWQTGVPDARISHGWLGRIGDLTTGAFNANSTLSIAMSIAGNSVMLTGRNVTQYRLTPRGAVRVAGLSQLYNSTEGATALRSLLSQPRSHLLENEFVRTSARALDNEVTVSAALANVTLATPFPATRLGDQLALVARMIGARAALGQRRQIFFVQASGYDTHDNLLDNHRARLAELGAALAAFDAALSELQAQPTVTTFTASDFGRALLSNGRGSDHGWGGHHFILGGAVRGGRVYGEFPSVALGSPQDAGQGRLIPSTAVDQYAATLARWFGVAASDLATVVPNIGRFSASDLGFLG
jgi:uncharacterized protein (DUF1501 family)